MQADRHVGECVCSMSVRRVANAAAAVAVAAASSWPPSSQHGCLEHRDVAAHHRCCCRHASATAVTVDIAAATIKAQSTKNNTKTTYQTMYHYDKPGQMGGQAVEKQASSFRQLLLASVLGSWCTTTAAIPSDEDAPGQSAARVAQRALNRREDGAWVDVRKCRGAYVLEEAKVVVGRHGDKVELGTRGRSEG